MKKAVRRPSSNQVIVVLMNQSQTCIAAFKYRKGLVRYRKFYRKFLLICSSHLVTLIGC